MRRRPLLIALAAALVVAGYVAFQVKGESELPVYTEAGARMLAQEEIYRRSDEKPFTYPPFFALPFVPFALLPDELHRPAWYFLNVAALALMLLVIRRTIRPALGAVSETVFWILLAALAARHVLAVFQNQSHDLLVCLAVVLAAGALGRGRAGTAGVWAGFGAAMKATPLLFGLAFLARLRWRALLGLAAGAVAATLLPDVLLPRPGGRSWAIAWYDTMVAGLGLGGTAERAGVWNAGSVLNQSLSGTLHRLTTPLDDSQLRVVDIAPVHLSDGARSALITGARLLVVGLIAAVLLRAPRSERPAADRAMRALGAAGLVACGMVLLSPMSSKSHFCVLLLPAAFCLADWLGRRRDPVVTACLAGAFVLGTLTTKGLFGGRLGNVLLAWGPLTWATVLLLAGTARALGSRERRRAAT
jgi:hypothetical protein